MNGVASGTATYRRDQQHYADERRRQAYIQSLGESRLPVYGDNEYEPCVANESTLKILSKLTSLCTKIAGSKSLTIT